MMSVDTTRIDKITSSRKEKTGPIYADFFVDLNSHPETGKIVRHLNADAVKRGLKNLIYTLKGERLYAPNKGCDLKKILFENFSDATTQMLKTYIEDAINTYEPRATLIEVVVKPYEDKNLYNVAIVFEIINTQEPQTLTLTLYRVR